MTIHANAIVENTRKTTVTFGDESADVVYKPTAYTARTEAKLRSLDGPDNSQKADALASILADLLVDFDYVHADGAPLEITKEDLTRVPFVVNAAVLNAIGEDMRPNVESAEIAAAGSLPAARSARARNGTR